MATLDLDAARAARAEAAGETHALVFGAVEFPLPAELPADFAFRLADGETRGALEALLAERFEEFWERRPTIEDLTALAEGVAKLYGFGDPGESSASAPSSANGGKRSRPTSSGSTRSTSARRALGVAK